MLNILFKMLATQPFFATVGICLGVEMDTDTVVEGLNNLREKIYSNAKTKVKEKEIFAGNHNHDILSVG